MSNQHPPADPQKQDPNSEEPKKPKFNRERLLMISLGLLFLALVIFSLTTLFKEKGSSSISELLNHIEQGEVDSLHGAPKATDMMLVTLVLKNQDAEESEEAEKTYAIPRQQWNDLVKIAREHDAEIKSVAGKDLRSVGSGTWFTLLLLFTMVALILYTSSSIGNSYTNISSKMGFNPEAEMDAPKTFKDVAGVPAAKQDLEEIIEFLKNPERFRKLGARIPKGVLLKGPPGTGKTLLAKATAGEAGVPFYSVAGSDFVQMFVGMGATRVRDSFRKAKANAPAIIFIDELDAVGKSRQSSASVGANDEREQTLNALLVEMDGFDQEAHVIVMAATNRPDVLDEALLRPGRFDRHVDVTRPHEKERREILDVHVRDVPLSDDVDLDAIAHYTLGFTGADLANLVNEATLYAARRDKTVVTALEFEDGFNRAIEGVPGTLTLSDPLMRQNTSAHEAGHTAVAYLLREQSLNEVHSTSIKPGVGFLGRMRSLPRTELAHVTRRKLLTEMAILYGGRAGEILSGEASEDLSAGAADDLRRMTAVAEHMVYEYGFGKRIGNRVLRESKSPSFYDSESSPLQIGADLQKEADEDVQELIGQAVALCIETITNEKCFHKAITSLLVKEEEVRGSELAKILAENPTEASAAKKEQETVSETA